MASCFKNPNKKKLSAKDYIIKKRRSIIFCDIREKMLDNYSRGDFVNGGGNNDACVDKDGVFTKYKNHKIQLDMLAAFEDFRNDLLTTVQGQIFKDHFCAPYFVGDEVTPYNNLGIKNYYEANNIQLAFGDGSSELSAGPPAINGTYGHLTNYFGALNQDIISLHPPGKTEYRNTYAEIKSVSSDLGDGFDSGFKNNKFVLLKPPICNNITRPQVFKPGDLSAPVLSGIRLLIE
tara:strand:+ start:34 stop:735 length:702 start_codon:yes stop_codon:yes gene_type:complete